MRRYAYILIALALAGVVYAQDARETNFSSGPQYLIPSGSTLFLRPIATPSLNLNAPLPPLPELPRIGPAVENQPYVTTGGVSRQPDLLSIYYGYQPVSEIELSGEQPRELPESISTPKVFNPGVWGVVKAGPEIRFEPALPVAQAASLWKMHPLHASRVYTNSDLERLKP